MKVLITVVTYNRLELLKKLIAALKNQTYKPSNILIVNNSSTDNTLEWLDKQQDLIVITQDNTGSSGGQNTAFKYAAEHNYDVLWAMDDDVLPENDTLEILMKYHNPDIAVFPLRYENTGGVFYNETKKYNFTNPFASQWQSIINQDDVKQKLIEIEGPTFEGPLVSIDLIKKIGLPDKKFFIFGDDAEYFFRAKLNGYKSYLVTEARLNRQLPAPTDEDTFSWKAYYSFRNVFCFDVLYGNIFVRYLRPIIYMLKFLTKAKNMDNIKTVLRSFRDGYFYKQEIELIKSK